MLQTAKRATLVYVLSGLLVSIELAVLISLIWFYKQGWTISQEAPSTLELMEQMPAELGLLVLLAVPLVIGHSLLLLRVFKRRQQETTP